MPALRVVPDVLAESFRADLRCDASAATRLAGLARDRLPRIASTSEDSDEDLVLRLRDPRVFGEFAGSLIRDAVLPRALREAMAERTFDLLPLPRGEGDVILVESRAPRGLLAIAGFVGDAGALTVLHVMHLVFAVFLDRGIVRDADCKVRDAVLTQVLAQTEANAPLRVLYAAMHLAAVPDAEAHRVFRRILRMRDVDDAVKSSLARAAAAEDGGVAHLLSLSRDEGLVPSEWTDESAPEVIANIPRLPPRLRAPASRWLARAH